MKTLEDIFCENHRCDAIQFRTQLFRTCLPLHIRPLAACLGGLAGNFFEADRELIAGVARATTMDAVRDEISTFFLHPANKRWLRAVGGVRVSTKRLKTIARQYLSSDVRKAQPA